MDEVAARALQERMAELCGQLNVLHAQLVDTVVAALGGGLWEQWGIRSPEQWLAWQTGLSPGRARQLVHTARRKADLPVTFGAFADGELSVDQVVALARYTPPHNDAEVCGLAKVATVAQLRATLSKYVHKVEPHPTDKPASAEAGFFFDDDGRFIMKVNAPADQGAVIKQALHEARDALFHDGHPDVTWLDALVEVANRSLDTVTSASRRDRYRIYVHLDTDTDTDGADSGAPRAWFNGGPALPPSLRDLLCCNATIRPLWHHHGVPVNVGRARYIVPAHTRRLITDRDRTCRHPGCNAHTFLDIHHIIEWLQGGATSLENLCLLCPKHHAAYHRGEFTMRGNANIPGGLRFYNQHGRPIGPTGKPTLPQRPPPTPAKQYIHPTGERLETRWIHFNTS